MKDMITLNVRDHSPFDEDLAATAGGDDRVHLWNIKSGKEILELDKFEDTVISVAFSHDGTYGATLCPFPPFSL